MLTSITAQPFHEVLFPVCSSRAVLTKQIVVQSCLMCEDGFSASQSCQDFSCPVYAPSSSVFLAGLCRCKGGVSIFLSVLGVASATPSDGSFSAGWGMDGLEMQHPLPLQETGR